MVTVKRLAIEAITKPMKLKGLTKAVARLDGERLDINLEALFIEFESQCLELDKIAGTKGGYRYFSFVQGVRNVVECFISEK